MTSVAGLVAAGLTFVPAAALATGSDETTLPFPTLGNALGVATDSGGDVFVLDNGQNKVLELPAGATSSSQVVTLPFSGLNSPSGIASDNTGDVFVADTLNNRVLELRAGSSQQVVLPFTGLGEPSGVGVDRAGDVFVTDFDNNRVLELPAGSSQQQTLPINLITPQALAVDAAGDIFVENGADLVELPAGATTATTRNLPELNGDTPIALAFDSAGDLFMATSALPAVFLELPSGSSTAVTLPIVDANYVAAIAVDIDGALYLVGGASPVVGVTAYESTSTSVSAPSSAVAGSPFTVHVTVQPSVSALAPQGDATVSDGAGGSCVAGLTGGKGSCDLTESVAGTYQVTASYPGRGAFTGSTSAPTTVQVQLLTAPVFTANTPPLTVAAGGTYQYDFAATGNPKPVFALDPAAPSWLAVDATTGAVTGTAPGGVSSFTYAVTASNTVGSATAGPFTVQVTSAPAFTTQSPPLTARPGAVYSYTFAASGNPTPVFGLSQDSPSWLSIDSSTGLLSGTPPTSITSFTYTVRALNSIGAASAGPFTVQLDTPPVFTADSPPLTVLPGGTYHYDFDASGIPAPTFSLVAGAPSWLSIDSITGLVTGTVPTGTDSFTYQVVAKNEVAAAQSPSFTVQVDTPPVFTADSPPLTVNTGGTYHYDFDASGIPAPTFSLVAGAPSWLSIDAITGVLSGTPPAGTASFSYQVVAKNEVAAAQSPSFTVQVDSVPVFLMASPPLTAVAGSPYGYTFAASGSPAPTYALAAGAPSWLSVDAVSGAVSGTPPTGTTSFTYSVLATNEAGSATAGPFTVAVSSTAKAKADVSVKLSCPTTLSVAAAGSCSVTVANAGPNAATQVAAAVWVPSALSVTGCTASCIRSGGLVVWKLGTLASGAQQVLSVSLVGKHAGTAVVPAAAGSSVFDPKLSNNIAAATITVK